MPADRLYQGPIYVKKSPIHGYGVFAASELAKDEVIEECHVLFSSASSAGSNSYRNYSFLFQEKVSLPLGFACIYNHSDQPNIAYHYDSYRGLVIFTTIRAVRKGEELFSSYGTSWFDSRNLRPKTTSWWRFIYCNGGRLALRATGVILGYFAFIQSLHYLSS